MRSIQVLGISASPIAGGNVELLLQQMLEQARAMDGVAAADLHLSELDVADCVHCNFCLKKQRAGKYCSIDDDGQKIFEQVAACDVLVLASPVYFMRCSGRMAALLDRLRVFVFGNLVGGRLRDKVGVSAAVAWGRNAGLETTHLTHMLGFLTLEMLPVSAHHSVSPLGASALSSELGSGIPATDTKLGVGRDEPGLQSGRVLIERAVGLARRLNRFL